MANNHETLLFSQQVTSTWPRVNATLPHNDVLAVGSETTLFVSHPKLIESLQSSYKLAGRGEARQELCLNARLINLQWWVQRVWELDLMIILVQYIHFDYIMYVKRGKPRHP